MGFTPVQRNDLWELQRKLSTGAFEGFEGRLPSAFSAGGRPNHPSPVNAPAYYCSQMLPLKEETTTEHYTTDRNLWRGAREPCRKLIGWYAPWGKNGLGDLTLKTFKRGSQFRGLPEISD